MISLSALFIIAGSVLLIAIGAWLGSGSDDALRLDRPRGVQETDLRPFRFRDAR